MHIYSVYYPGHSYESIDILFDKTSSVYALQNIPYIEWHNYCLSFWLRLVKGPKVKKFTHVYNFDTNIKKKKPLNALCQPNYILSKYANEWPMYLSLYNLLHFSFPVDWRPCQSNLQNCPTYIKHTLEAARRGMTILRRHCDACRRLATEPRHLKIRIHGYLANIFPK